MVEDYWQGWRDSTLECNLCSTYTEIQVRRESDIPAEDKADSDRAAVIVEAAGCIESAEVDKASMGRLLSETLDVIQRSIVQSP